MTVPMARSQLMGGGSKAGKEAQEEEAREREQQQRRQDPDEIKVSVSKACHRGVRACWWYSWGAATGGK